MMNIKKEKQWFGALSIVCSLFMVGCLTTRTQLREHAQAFAEAAQVEEPEQKMKAYAVDELRSEMSQLSGRVDDLEHAAKTDLSSFKQQNQEILSRFTQLEPQTQTALEQLEQLNDRLKLLEEQFLEVNPEHTWLKATQAAQQKDYEKALNLLNLYTQKDKGKNLQSAWFLKGLYHYKLKQYKKAILSFSQFQEKFSNSPRVPEALYHIGLCFDALNLKTDAQGFYQEILEKYPGSPEGKILKANAAREAKKRKKPQ